LYWHVWETLAWLLRHPRWGPLGLPLCALFYVRRKDIGKVPRGYGVKFQTKLQQGAAQVTRAADWLKYLGKALWVRADGAYAKRTFLDDDDVQRPPGFSCVDPTAGDARQTAAANARGKKRGMAAPPIRPTGATAPGCFSWSASPGKRGPYAARR
jgi:hypothetical protein